MKIQTINSRLFLIFFYLVAIISTIVTEDSFAKNGADSETLVLTTDQANQVVMKSSNGCGIENFLIPSTGDSSLGMPPLIGTLSFGGQNPYKVVDTIPGTQIKGIAFNRPDWPHNTSIMYIQNFWYPYVVVSDSGMFSYEYDDEFNPVKSEQYSTFIPGIIRMANQVTTDKTNPIVLLVKDADNDYSLRFFLYPDLQEKFSFDFHFEPEIFEVSNNALFLSGWDTSGSYMLYQFSTIQDSLLAVFTLNDAASNAKEILKFQDSLFILSSPGDTATVLTSINRTNGALSQTIINPIAGARATYNEFKLNQYFTFQPMEDVTDSILDRQIIVLDPETGQTDTLMINRRLDKFKHPNPHDSGFGQFSMGWIGAKWRNGMSDSIFISSAYSPNMQVQTQTGAFPQYINAVHRCWVGLYENETEEIRFDVYPNPASSEVILSLTGLNKGREYKLTINDISGKVHYETYLEAYQEKIIPIQMLSSGMYLLNLDTGKNIITQKLIIK